MIARFKQILAACALAIPLAVVAVPQSPVMAAPSCSSAGFRQMNFLLGNWTVTKPDGALLGHDSFIHALGNCGFYEYWRDGAEVHRGFAMLAYQPGAHSWHLTWLDDSGMAANFDGSPTPLSALSMDGVDYMGPTRRLHHVVWTELPDGTIEKVWKTSSDDGRHWAVTFDAIYHPQIL